MLRNFGLAGNSETCPTCGNVGVVPVSTPAVRKSPLLQGVITAVVIVVILVGWGAIRASKGTFWLFDSNPGYSESSYRTYTDPDRTFSVDLPSSLVVKQQVKNIPVEGGQMVEVRIYTAGSGSEEQGYGLGLSSYHWNITESPDQFAANRLSNVVVGMGGTLSSTESVQRPGCTAVKGFGEGTKNGQPIQIMAEICVKGNQVFCLNAISTGSTVNLADRSAVKQFFSTFRPSN